MRDARSTLPALGALLTIAVTWGAITTAQITAQTSSTPAPPRPKDGDARLVAFDGIRGGDPNERGGMQVKVVQVASGLVSPWSIVFIPGTNDALIAERPGRVRLLHDNVLDPAPVYTMPAEPLDRAEGRNSAERLHFLALHPQFVQNRLVYLSYMKWGPRGHTPAVARGRFDGKALTDVRDVFVADAWIDASKASVPGATACGRIAFGPDGMLYLTVGDRDYLWATDDTSVRINAQDLRNHIGKVLRIRDDGSVPADNPFVNQPGVKPEIYTYGHRNAMGLTFLNGRVWEVEIGPMSGDELNLLLPGHNYGWPLVSLGRIYTNHLVSNEPWFRPGMDNPEMFWAPSVSPSSVIVYTGDRFPGWKGSLLMGALNGRALWHILMTEEGLTQKGAPNHNLESLSLGARIRDVAQGPDGDVYLCTEDRGVGDSSTNGTILRIEPAS